MMTARDVIDRLLAPGLSDGEQWVENRSSAPDDGEAIALVREDAPFTDVFLVTVRKVSSGEAREQLATELFGKPQS